MGDASPPPKGFMAYDKNYYDEKKQTINIKYVKSLEELVDELALTLNKFFAYKGELNEQLREIMARETEGTSVEKVTEEKKDDVTEESGQTEEVA